MSDCALSFLPCVPASLVSSNVILIFVTTLDRGGDSDWEVRQEIKVKTVRDKKSFKILLQKRKRERLWTKLVKKGKNFF